MIETDICKSIYVHIPFCTNICSYCDFCKYFYNEKMVDDYLKALEKEINTKYKNEVIETIYVGGGTPTSISYAQLSRFLEILKKINVDNLEYTVEINVENIDEDKIKLLSSYGVNRISIGVQTFNEKYLKLLNRKHNKEQVITAINMIKKYISNINIDLIYALPGQTLEELNKDIDEFIALDIPHISTYSLIIEEHTILNNNNVENIDEELDYEMYKLICNRLKEYDHYEISNFGKLKSRHNLTYWNNEHYYGFGLGASGYIDNIRYTNTRSLNNYINGKYIIEEEELDFNETIENLFILGFRKTNGINIDDTLNKYHINILDIDIVKELIKEKKLLVENNNLKINIDYIYTSNDILTNFLGGNYERYIQE